LKQEFIGRLLGAGKDYESELREGKLADLLLCESKLEGSAVSLADPYKPFYAGPLEGAQPSPHEVPEEVRTLVEKQLSKPSFEPSSFVGVINLAEVFEIEADMPLRVAEMIKKGKYQLLKVAGTEELLAILSGLAKVAAVSRNQELAQEVRILLRKYRRDPGFAIAAEYSVRILLIAAAAYSGLQDWLRFVGESFEELSFDSSEKDEAQALKICLQSLCVAVPELWTVIGAADAALSAFLMS
jgi:hypothetical protein